MKMSFKSMLCLLLLAFISQANAAIALVQKNTAAVFSTTASVSLSSVGAGHLVVLELYGSASGTPTVSETAPGTDTVNTAVAYGCNATPNACVGIYYIQNSVGGTTTLQVTFTASTGIGLVEIEYSGAATTGALDSATAINSATNSSTVSTASLTPASSGELGVVGAAITTNSTVTWSAPFTSQETQIGNTIHGTYADEIGTTGAITPSGTISLGNSGWAAAMVLFKAASGGGSCTHDGITSAGAIAIPNGTSGTYRLTSGALGTPDCSTVSYKQTQGAVGVN